jgi:hypothetical protein
MYQRNMFLLITYKTSSAQSFIVKNVAHKYLSCIANNNIQIYFVILA